VLLLGLLLGDGSSANNATLQFSVAGPYTNPITIAAGGTGLYTIQNAVNSVTVALSGGIAVNNNLTLNAIAGNASILNITGALIGGYGTTLTSNSSVTAAGSYVQLSGANSGFVGNVLVNTGTLLMGGASALNRYNTVTLASVATFELNAKIPVKLLAASPDPARSTTTTPQPGR